MELKNSKRSAKGWKTRRDNKALEGYEKQLRARRKEYSRIATADSLSGRRNRALAVGECVLQMIDELRKLNQEKSLLDGSLWWTINEQREKDTDGRKGFQYTVAWFVKSEEDYYTEEEIRQEIENVKAKMKTETSEMFDDEDAEE